MYFLKQLSFNKKSIFVILSLRIKMTSTTGDRTWGTSSAWNLAATEIYGRPSTSSDDFIELSKDDLQLEKYKNGYHASHCLIYAKNDKKIFNTYSARATCLMQMRFDGYIGFPGGLVDSGETPIQALNRELNEEINLSSNLSVSENDHICSHWSISKSICLHFYALELNIKQLEEVEINALKSHDYGTEVLGTVRVPLYTMGDGFRGLPCFLTHSFIGNAKQQLIASLLKLNILNKEEINLALNSKPVPVKVFIPPSSNSPKRS